jgi:hypothetical protein
MMDISVTQGCGTAHGRRVVSQNDASVYKSSSQRYTVQPVVRRTLLADESTRSPIGSLGLVQGSATHCVALFAEDFGIDLEPACKAYSSIKIRVFDITNVHGVYAAIHGHAADRIRAKSNHRQKKAHLDEHHP